MPLTKQEAEPSLSLAQLVTIKFNSLTVCFWPEVTFRELTVPTLNGCPRLTSRGGKSDVPLLDRQFLAKHAVPVSW